MVGWERVVGLEAVGEWQCRQVAVWASGSTGEWCRAQDGRLKPAPGGRFKTVWARWHGSGEGAAEGGLKMAG